MDKDVYLTIAKPSEGIFREKGSKFMAFAFPVNNEDEIKIRLEELRRKYHDARHHCYAWRLRREQYRVNDAGEPHNSAGRPIYGQIQSFNLCNILIVVVRYFGGTLLGVPGLVNAYKTAAFEALKDASVVEKYITSTLKVTFGYDHMNQVMKTIKDMNLEQSDQIFEQSCQLKVRVQESMVPAFMDHFRLTPEIKIEYDENT